MKKKKRRTCLLLGMVEKEIYCRRKGGHSQTEAGTSGRVQGEHDPN